MDSDKKQNQRSYTKWMCSSFDCCGQRWIRTTEGISQQIYSLPHLATLVFALTFFVMQKYGLFLKLPSVINHFYRCKCKFPSFVTGSSSGAFHSLLVGVYGEQAVYYRDASA